jgi:hypothetical protein
MAESNTSFNVDSSGGMFILGVVLLVILFWGEPDLHDALIHRLMGPDAVQVQTDGTN